MFTFGVLLASESLMVFSDYFCDIILLMYLKELTLQGFKTFAKKTTLQFSGPKDDRKAITAIVGPNGSGKSNVADAIRWVLGEQSIKTLRGKNSTDVIFSGAQGKTRAGFAEVNITFADMGNVPGFDMAELTITRRLYRDGESAYLINGQSARLSDIAMLLAQSNVGQKSYAIINQGQIDKVLSASPEERKAFFDDATGVKPLQLKRHRAISKLKRTRENIDQAELLLEELIPRLRTLKRLVNRLNEREVVEKELLEKRVQYYGALWNRVNDKLSGEMLAYEKQNELVLAQTDVLERERNEFKAMEAREKEDEKVVEDNGLSELQSRYDAVQDTRRQLQRERFDIEKKLEMAKVTEVSHWTPLPLSKIIEHISGIKGALKGLKDKLRAGELVESDLDTAFKSSETLLSRLQKPAPEVHEPDKELLARQSELKTEDKVLGDKLVAIRDEMRSNAASSKKERKELFALQRRLLAAQERLHSLEGALNSHKVALARLETRSEDIEREMKEDLGNDVQLAKDFEGDADIDSLRVQIQGLAHKMELIGGIDDETVSEFEEASQRHDFLDSQITDLNSALKDTEEIVRTLDKQIREQAGKAFVSIQEKFEHYFKLLFRGGAASLKELKVKDLPVSSKSEDDGSDEDDVSEALTAEELDRVIGVDILATPPGKKLKSINLLSGGERALTSIALISAIMSTNPSPFVVLDEVDAALDESNTVRFAEIVKELSLHTQFVLITHNRATMHTADVLYGVTMQSDGVSKLISVKMEEIDETTSSRR